MKFKNFFNKIGKIWNLQTIFGFLKNKYNSKVTKLKEKLTGLNNHTKKRFQIFKKNPILETFILEETESLPSQINPPPPIPL